MTYKNVLLEIGTEEIPSRFLPDTLEFLEKTAKDDFKNARIGFKSLSVFATPRRIALMVKDVDDQQQRIGEQLDGWRRYELGERSELVAGPRA